MNEFRQIVWIASYPKSGNTWVRLFLDAYFLGELDINEIVTSIGDNGIERYNVGYDADLWRWPIDIQQLTRGMAMLRTVLAYNDTPHGDLPLFVKTHQSNAVANGVELLPAALTKATIFIVRDPRDVFPSFANHMGSDLETAFEQITDKYQVLAAQKHRVGDFISSWGASTEAYLSSDQHNTLVVSYENLRKDPVSEFSSILRHSGIEPDMDRVRSAVDLTELSKLRKKEQDAGFGEGSDKAKDPFFNTGEVGKSIPSQYKSRLERAFRKTMLTLGYLGKKRLVA